MKKETFKKIQEKYIRGIYQELNLLTEKEKRQHIFKLSLSMKIELLKECQKYMNKTKKEEYKTYIEKISIIRNNQEEKDLLARGVFYLHHHFLNGNSMFTYAINQCSKKWTIDYLKKHNKQVTIPIDKELIFLGFLGFLTEKNEIGQYQVQIYLIEYYLFVLEMLGYIKRKGKKIYIKGYAYKKVRNVFNQADFTGKKDKSIVLKKKQML